MSPGIVYILKFVDIENQKGVERIRAACPEKCIDDRRGVFLIIKRSQTIDLGGVYKLPPVSGMDHGNAADQKKNQEHEIAIQRKLIIVDEFVALVGNGYGNDVAHHPVV